MFKIPGPKGIVYTTETYCFEFRVCDVSFILFAVLYVGNKKKCSKKNQHKKTHDFVDSKSAKSKNKVQKRVAKKKLPDNALGNDPKLRAIFEQFTSQ